MEFSDVYDKEGNLTGRTHLRGKPWKKGEYGYVVCVWVHDGKGNLLLTRRAKEKTFPGTWENSGGAVQAGETPRQAIVRELFEETGICAEPEEFEQISYARDRCIHYNFYCLKRDIPLSEVVLQPGETDDAQWVTFDRMHQMIARKEICKVIGIQFLRQEAALLARQSEK